jgi:hypothetical protein
LDILDLIFLAGSELSGFAGKDSEIAWLIGVLEKANSGGSLRRWCLDVGFY